MNPRAHIDRNGPSPATSFAPIPPAGRMINWRPDPPEKKKIPLQHFVISMETGTNGIRDKIIRRCRPHGRQRWRCGSVANHRLCHCIPLRSSSNSGRFQPVVCNIMAGVRSRRRWPEFELCGASVNDVRAICVDANASAARSNDH